MVDYYLDGSKLYGLAGYYYFGELTFNLILLLYNLAYFTDSALTYASNLFNSSIYQSTSRKYS